MAKPKRNRKGQFMKKSRATKRRKSTRKGMKRKTARRAYMKKSAPRRRRRSRKNPPKKVLTSVILWSSLTAFGQGYVKSYLAKATGSPMAASYGTIAAVGALGYWLMKKAKTTPAGYAVLGVAFAKLAGEIGSATGLFNESGAGFVPKSSVIRRLPKRVNIPSMNPVGRIVVPG